jgi:Haem-NO-binding
MLVKQGGRLTNGDVRKSHTLKMKGIVFTELLDMVGQMKSEDFVDELIETCDLASGGSYTAVGTYPHQEAVTIVMRLSEMTGSPPGDLLRIFGNHLFGRFAVLYPVFFESVDNAIDFLAQIEDVIHVEVRKLYPDAELPSFDAYRPEDGKLDLTYRSDRHMGDLAEGLISGCVAHFGIPHSVERSDAADGSILFRVTRLE